MQQSSSCLSDVILSLFRVMFHLFLCSGSFSFVSVWFYQSLCIPLWSSCIFAADFGSFLCSFASLSQRLRTGATFQRPIGPRARARSACSVIHSCLIVHLRVSAGLVILGLLSPLFYTFKRFCVRLRDKDRKNPHSCLWSFYSIKGHNRNSVCSYFHSKLYEQVYRAVLLVSLGLETLIHQEGIWLIPDFMCSTIKPQTFSQNHKERLYVQPQEK